MNYFQKLAKEIGDYLASLVLFFTNIKNAVTDGVNASNGLKTGEVTDNITVLGRTNKMLRFSFQNGTAKIIDIGNFTKISLQYRSGVSSNTFRIEQSNDLTNWVTVKVRDKDGVLLTTDEIGPLPVAPTTTLIFITKVCRYIRIYQTVNNSTQRSSYDLFAEADKPNGYTDSITVWGDSLPSGAGGTQTLGALLSIGNKRFIETFGIGGQKSEQIAARQSGLPIYLTADYTLGTTANASLNINFLSTPASTANITETVVILGKHYFVDRTVVNSVETYTIRPVENSTSTLPAGTLIEPDNAFNTIDNINVFWMGRNNVPTLTDIPSITAKCVARLNRPRRYIIVGVLNAYLETGTNASYLAILACNAILRTTYGDRYVEVTPPTLLEMSEIGYTPTPQDLTDIANGVFPFGLRAKSADSTDNTHLNSGGYQIMANRVKAKLTLFGW